MSFQSRQRTFQYGQSAVCSFKGSKPGIADVCLQIQQLVLLAGSLKKLPDLKDTARIRNDAGEQQDTNKPLLEGQCWQHLAAQLCSAAASSWGAPC